MTKWFITLRLLHKQNLLFSFLKIITPEIIVPLNQHNMTLVLISHCIIEATVTKKFMRKEIPKNLATIPQKAIQHQ